MIETNFKHTDIGVIPHDWEVKKLGAIYSFRYGIGNTNPNNGGKYPIYGANGVIGGYSKYNAEDSIVIGHMGEYAGSVLWAEGKHFVTYNGTITRPKEENSINAKYGFYALLKLNINNICAGSGYPFLAYDKLNSLKIPLPPTLAEQEKIANALSKIDQLINDLGALIEKKKAIKQGTMQDLLTAKRRLKGFTRKWEEARLCDLGLIIRGVSFKPEQASVDYKNGYICLLRSNNIDNARINYENIIYVDSACVNEYQFMRHDDILICAANGSRNLVGKAGRKIDDRLNTFGAFMCVFRCKDAKNAPFVSFLLQSNSYFKQLDEILSGSAINNLNAKQFENMVFLTPPTFAEQNAIANILSSMDTEITNLEQKRDKYIAIKQGMMQNLLTGKIRLI